MKVIIARNVNEAYSKGIQYLNEVGLLEDSRAGRVLVAPWPVTTLYLHPCERVLHDPTRDANPFFHLYEALWMLSGSEDAKPLDQYVKNFSSRFAEENGLIHGAYGYRWRYALGYDQIEHVVATLETDPTSRQCVIQMWDGMAHHEVTQDRLGVGTVTDRDAIITGSDDLRGSWRDRPCNTHIYLRVRENRQTRGGDLCVDQYLDMTVCCRSNDIIWGAYGANAVHFSILQEYLAGRIGVDVGKYYQISNNFHAYVGELGRVGTPQTYWPSLKTMPIGNDWHAWDDDLKSFMSWHDGGLIDREPKFKNDWFKSVVVPMCMANFYRRRGNWYIAKEVAKSIASDDWRNAALAWLERRKK